MLVTDICNKIKTSQKILGKRQARVIRMKFRCALFIMGSGSTQFEQLWTVKKELKHWPLFIDFISGWPHIAFFLKPFFYNYIKNNQITSVKSLKKKKPVKELFFSNSRSLHQKQNSSKVFFKDFAYSGTPNVNFHGKSTQG